MLAIPKGSKHQKQTEAFVDWTIQHSSKWAQPGNIPAMNSVRDSTFFKSPPGRTRFAESMLYEVMLLHIPKGARVSLASGISPIMMVAQEILVQDKNMT